MGVRIITASALVLATIVCVLPTAGTCQQKPVFERGHVFFESDFESPAGLKGWSGSVKLGPGFESDRSLYFEQSSGSPAGSIAARIGLPVEQMRGHLVYFSAMIKAEGVSQKPQPWNGVKFMAPIVAGDGRSWPQGNIGIGTFDWKRVVFPVRVPEDATEISLHLGLEAVTGKAWFDNIRVTVRKPPFVPGPRRAGVPGPVFKGHDLPRLRGAMISPDINEEGLRLFGQEWNANLIRWQLVRHRPVNNPLDMAAYDRWLDGELKKLDAALPLCEKYGLMVVVDLHSPPGGHVLSGGYAGSGEGLFGDAACQKKFLEVWEHIARRYRNARTIWGFDLANEPVENVVEENLADWEELAERTARAIRAVDPGRTLIVEPAQWGNPAGLRYFKPLNLPNVVYSVHMYLPHSFTHQGVHNPKDKPLRYPGEIDGKLWDKAALEAALKPVVDFQKTHGVHIYIGEFSAIRWAPDNSAYRYLKDLIDIFEQHGWDWSYHAFREWNGWSVEHGPDRTNNARVDPPTDRQRLLRTWFEKNKKPAWYK